MIKTFHAKQNKCDKIKINDEILKYNVIYFNNSSFIFCILHLHYKTNVNCKLYTFNIVDNLLIILKILRFAKK